MSNDNQQTALFNENNYETKQQKQAELKKKQAKLAALTPDDKAYMALQKAHLAKKLHIYSGSYCESALFWYVTNGNVLSNTADKLVTRISKINPKYYYHYSANENPLKATLVRYNASDMEKVLEIKPDNDDGLDKLKANNWVKDTDDTKDSNSNDSSSDDSAISDSAKGNNSNGDDNKANSSNH